MKINSNTLVLCLSTLLWVGTALAQQKQNTSPPVAGAAAALVGVTVEEVVVIAQGWSMRKQILDRKVYNDKNEKLGKVDDVIVSPDKSVSWAIIGVGGFLGLGKKDVAIPISQLHMEKDRFVLPNATKEAVKAMPEFQYAK